MAPGTSAPRAEKPGKVKKIAKQTNAAIEEFVFGEYVFGNFGVNLIASIRHTTDAPKFLDAIGTP